MTIYQHGFGGPEERFCSCSEKKIVQWFKDRNCLKHPKRMYAGFTLNLAPKRARLMDILRGPALQAWIKDRL